MNLFNRKFLAVALLSCSAPFVYSDPFDDDDCGNMPPPPPSRRGMGGRGGPNAGGPSDRGPGRPDDGMRGPGPHGRGEEFRKERQEFLKEIRALRESIVELNKNMQNLCESLRGGNGHVKGHPVEQNKEEMPAIPSLTEE